MAAGGVGGLLHFCQGSENYLPMYDASHNVVGWSRQSNGAIMSATAYSPFGEVLQSWTDATFSGKAQIGFSSKYTDAETGLVYYGYRYYHPKLGRFINRDPIGTAGGLNLYGLVGNDPVNRTDMLGLFWVCDPYYEPRHIYDQFREEWVFERWFVGLTNCRWAGPGAEPPDSPINPGGGGGGGGGGVTTPPETTQPAWVDLPAVKKPAAQSTGTATPPGKTTGSTTAMAGPQQIIRLSIGFDSPKMATKKTMDAIRASIDYVNNVLKANGINAKVV